MIPHMEYMRMIFKEEEMKKKQADEQSDNQEMEKMVTESS